MCSIKQDQLPFYYSSESESELFTSDRLQLQLYKTSLSIRDIDLYLASVQEVKKTDDFFCHDNKLKYCVKHFAGIANCTEVSGVLLEKMNSSRRFI